MNLGDLFSPAMLDPETITSGLSGDTDNFESFRRNQILQAAALAAMQQIGAGANTGNTLLSAGIGALAGRSGAKSAWEDAQRNKKRSELEDLLLAAKTQEALNPTPKPLSMEAKLKADRDKGLIDEATYQAGLERLRNSGRAPSITVAPTVQLGDSNKFQGKLAEELAKNYAANMQSYQESANKYSQMKPVLRQLAAGQGEFKTGPLANVRGWVGQIAELGGIPAEQIPDIINPRGYATVASADSQIRLAFMEAAKGNLNQEEMRVLGTAGPGLLYSQSGNDTLVKTFDALADRAQLKADFFNQAALSGYNVLTGKPIAPADAEKEWNNYIQNTPLFGKDILEEMSGNSISDINRRLMYSMPPDWVREAPEHEVLTMLPSDSATRLEFYRFIQKNNPELYHAIEAKLQAGEAQ